MDEQKKYQKMQTLLNQVVKIAATMPYEKNQEAVLINARRAQAAASNRIAELKIRATETA